MADQGWALIVHGGARSIAPRRHEANRRGCVAAIELGGAILAGGGSALDAAEAAVRTLEDDMTFNAGSGSVPTRDGTVEMDAGMMDGSSLAVGAVASLGGVRNPVAVARLLLDEEPVLLVGGGAAQFARSRGIPGYTVPAALDADAQHDTVGCVALDDTGRIAVATSTGGLPGQWPGRVGDAPIPGCGYYADDHAGGVAISGDGEAILRTHLAAHVIGQLYRQPVGSAVAAGIAALARVGGEAGIIALDRDGRFGVAHNSEHFAVALMSRRRPEAKAGVVAADFEGYLND